MLVGLGMSDLISQWFIYILNTVYTKLILVISLFEDVLYFSVISLVYGYLSDADSLMLIPWCCILLFSFWLMDVWRYNFVTILKFLFWSVWNFLRNLLRHFSLTKMSIFTTFLYMSSFAPATLCADNVDLGTACGKFHRVSCLSIIDPGNMHLSCKIVLVVTKGKHTVWLTYGHDDFSGDSDIIKSLPGDH